MKINASVCAALCGLIPMIAQAFPGDPPSPDAPIAVRDFKAPIRLACVGDSITFGAGTANPALGSYPAQLGRMLDAHWQVANFGVSGATLLNSGDKPYQQEGQFQNALKFQPNVVVIMLGTNDTKPRNWPAKAQYGPDYQDLIRKFATLESKPRVFVCLPVPVPGIGNYGINEAGIREEIPLIQAAAKAENAGVIDLHAALAGQDRLFPDRVHPNEGGAELMARAVYRSLTGDAFNGPVPAVAPAP